MARWKSVTLACGLLSGDVSSIYFKSQALVVQESNTKHRFLCVFVMLPQVL
jgi:hypothetical protein